jgi:hypothetical protein
MATGEHRTISTPDDPRLERIGREPIAGADQILARLAATPDDRLDSLIALAEFVSEAREALSQLPR